MKKIYYICVAAMAILIGGSIADGRLEAKEPVMESPEEAARIEAMRDSLWNNFVEESSVVEETPDLEFATSEAAIDYMRDSGYWSEYSTGIIPQMAEENLEYATKLLNNSHDGFVVVDKARMKVIKFDKFGREETAYGMACGKNYGTKHKRSDCRTPEGFFAVKQIQNSTDWKYVDDDGNVSQKTGEFGPRFIRLNIPGINSIGIHGTCAPWSIGGRRSHGCIRVKNENILDLVERVDVGMPVIVSPGKRDLAVNQEEGYSIPQIHTALTHDLQASR